LLPAVVLLDSIQLKVLEDLCSTKLTGPERCRVAAR
jgi:hypothetical protein